MFAISIASSASHFSQEHFIFGHHYVLEFEWNERESYWFMHVYDNSQQPIALGLKLLPHWPLLKDIKRSTGFMLIPTTPHATLNRTTLHSDFALIAYALI